MEHRPSRPGPAPPLGLDGLRTTLRRDPYTVLGVRPGAPDEEIRAAYRRLVQLHHPDHNHGSVESARRFEEVQEAYAAITRERRRSPTPPRWTPPPPSSPDVEERLAALDRELREKARRARERAQRAAREAAAAAASRRERERPSDEELGYIRTDDTLGKILADARKEISDRLGDVREPPLRDRVADLLDDVAAVLRSEHRSAGEGRSQSPRPDGDQRP